MTNRIIVVAALSLCSSCAWLFQDKLPREYSGNSEPVCSTSNGWATVDGVWAVLNGASAIAVASDDTVPSEDATAYVVGGVIGVVVHVASAVSGGKWASECREARVAFEDRERQQAVADVQRASLVQPQPAVTPQPAQAPSAPALVPRGFYCASSASVAVSFCVRDKAECERTREVSLGAVPDLDACTLVETAWCFGSRCAATEKSCTEQSERANGLACAEAR